MPRWLWMFFSSSFCEDFVSKLSNVNHHIERVGCKWYTTNSESKFLCREFILCVVLLHLFALPPKSWQWMEKGSRVRRLISFRSSLIVVSLNDGKKNEVFLMVKRNFAITRWDIFETLVKNWRSSNLKSFFFCLFRFGSKHSCIVAASPPIPPAQRDRHPYQSTLVTWTDQEEIVCIYISTVHIYSPPEMYHTPHSHHWKEIHFPKCITCGI